MFHKSPDLDIAMLLVFVYPVKKISSVIWIRNQGVGMIGEVLNKSPPLVPSALGESN
jgi:hypothetical protein